MEKIEINDIIEKNKKYGGSLMNRSNLEFDIDKANNEKNPFRSNAHIIRGIVSGHCFFDGCKSTAIDLVINRMKQEGIKCNERKMVLGLVNIAKNQIGDVHKIEKRLRKWCKR